jgi:ABC-2 type transport system ATP-binding protein
VASHLLGEIERVSDYLVAIDAGRLLHAAPLGTFTERTGYLAVEVEEGEDRLVAALAAGGLLPAVDGRTVVVPIEDERPYDIVRDALAELGLPLVRLEQRRKGLEDLFADAPVDDPDPAAPVGTGRPR